MGRKFFLVVLPMVLVFCLINAACDPGGYGGGSGREDFGVFIGLDGSGDLEKLKRYDMVVIDASGFSREDIHRLRRGDVKVYSYLNIGSIEEFRDYYQDFADLALGDYTGWDDEKWIDVSAPRWRDYVIQTLAGALAGKGIDGFFIDNADVYYEFPREEIYAGFLDILKGIGSYGLPVLVNGGDTFIERALERGDLQDTPVKGINQECVFTYMESGTGRMDVQTEETTTYFQNYLSRCKNQGLDVYLTEYAPENSLEIRQKIGQYCRAHQYRYYIAPSWKLD